MDSSSLRRKRPIVGVLLVSLVASLTILRGHYVLRSLSSNLKHAANSSSIALTDSSNTNCPRIIEKARGIFRNKDTARDKGLNHVVLLTAANSAYYDFLQNWEYMADQLGLQWVVLAMDHVLFEKLGPDRAIPNDPRYNVEGATSFREKAFNKLSCNKLRSVLHIVEACHVDVVFSDIDNVFFENPFEHDLGKLISSNYDYVYQPNMGRVTQPRQHRCLANGERVKEGNTGFYFLSRKSDTLKQIIRDTLDVCAQPDNALDDQKLFWNEMRKHPTRHCSAAEVYDPHSISPDNAPSNATASLCCLDPYYYPTGRMPHEHMVTFHANYCRGKDAKVAKLQNARKDGYGWDPSRINDSNLPL